MYNKSHYQPLPPGLKKILGETLIYMLIYHLEPTKEDHLGLLIGLREAVQDKPLMGTGLGV